MEPPWALCHFFGEAEPRQLLQASCSQALFHAVPRRRPDQATLVGRGDQPSINAGQPLLFHLVQARAHDLPIGARPQVQVDDRGRPLAKAMRHIFTGDDQRSEESRVGTEWVSTCRSRWATYHEQKKK